MIEIKNFRINTDKFQWIIEKKYINQKTKEVYYIPVTYHPNLKYLSGALLEYELRGTEFTDLKDILEKLKEFEGGIKILVENEHQKEMV